MKGILLNKHGWVIEYSTYSGPGKKANRTVELQEDNKIDPRLSYMEGTEVDFEMLKINPMGRVIDPMDLTQDQSQCKWFAKLKPEGVLEPNSTRREKPEEYILCAAVWYKDLPIKKPEILEPRGFRPYNVDRGVVVSGWCHGNCIYQMVAITGLRSIPAEAGEEIQGFLTSRNRFVDRKEAGEIAFAAGQTTELKKTLYSEDLY